MRVFEGIEGWQVVCHMGRCPPKHATGFSVGKASWPHTRLLMRALNSSTRLMVNCAMVHHICHIPAAPSLISAASWITVVCVILSYSTIVSEFDPFQGSSTLFKRRAQVPGACDLEGVRSQSELGSKGLRLSWSSVAMPQEWLRMLSRRGGSRGCAISQRSTPLTHSFTEVLEPRRNSPPATRSGRGRGCGRGRRDDCEHAAHPIVRYRIPCTLANSTFIISVTIEKCEDLRGQGEALPEVPVDQRRVPPIDSQRRVTGSSSMANQAVSAGPSEPAQRESIGSMILHSDSDDSLQFGCRVVEEPYTTDDD